MNILAAIKSEERNIEQQVRKLQKRLDGLRAAARALGTSASYGLDKARKRVLSAAGRARISAAAKRRWAKVKAGTKKAVGKSATDGLGKVQKRVMSAAARAKISAAMKRRWSKVGAGARKAAS
jgi:prophage DNA circulation protein